MDWQLPSIRAAGQSGTLCFFALSFRGLTSGPSVSASPHPLPCHPASASASHPGVGLEAFVTRRLRVRGLADTEMEALGFPQTQTGALLCEGGSVGTLGTFPSAPELQPELKAPHPPPCPTHVSQWLNVNL